MSVNSSMGREDLAGTIPFGSKMEFRSPPGVDFHDHVFFSVPAICLHVSVSSSNP